jgi:hypothetical protein
MNFDIFLTLLSSYVKKGRGRIKNTIFLKMTFSSYFLDKEINTGYYNYYKNLQIQLF